MNKFLTVFITVICLTAAVESNADKADDKATALFEQGVMLYNEGKFDKASAAFESAYKRRPSYKLLWNIAQVQNELGNFALAITAYRKYLDEGGDEIHYDRKSEVKVALKRLDVLVGELNIVYSEPGASIFLDGKKVGVTPLGQPVLADLGDHELEVKKGRRGIYREVVRVGGGESVTVEIDVESEAQYPAPGQENPDESDATKKRVLPWIALGAGAAFGITGGILGGVSISKKKTMLENCDGNLCSPSDESTADSIKKLNITADVMFAVAGAAAITGIVLFFVPTDSKEDESSAQTLLTPIIGPSGAGAALVGRF